MAQPNIIITALGEGRKDRLKERGCQYRVERGLRAAGFATTSD
jgi:hypothetical protein